jgi:C-terminal processing protease CtpA/Prc
MKKLYPLIIISLFTIIISACRKSPNIITPNSPGTTLDKIKDSIYLYAKEDYLWNGSLPTYANFQPRTYTNASDLTALAGEMNALSQYAINPATSLPYEYYANDPGDAKYSFIDDGTETAALNGTKGDYGFDLQYNTVSDLRIEYVYPSSPAGLAGIKRGYRIISINNNTNISYDAQGYGTGTGVNLAYVSNAIFNSSTVTMTLERQDSTTFSATLNIANYTVNPVLKDTILNQGNGHVVGYLVFNSFTSDAVADPVLDAAFSDFASNGVTDLVVDLRYNGGGYVSTAEHLDNLIVPSSKSNTLMYNTYFNSNLVSGKDPLLSHQWRTGSNGDYNYGQLDYSVAGNAVNFSKIGTLNVGRVFFIITGNTASASELTINNLRPVMDVEFVGETSYGKPVGFFDIDINKYIMYTPEFYVENAAGQGGYYAGFTPGATGYPGIKDYDDLTRDFGDPTEGLLADVLSYVNTGTYAVNKPAVQSLKSAARTFALATGNRINMHIQKPKFTGMIIKHNSLINKLRIKKN